MEPVYKDMTGKVLTRKGLEYFKFPDGSEQWDKDGDFHRLHGPARKLISGAEYYYIEGEHTLKEDFDHAWTCPMTELPLLINMSTAPIARWRLAHGTV